MDEIKDDLLVEQLRLQCASGPEQSVLACYIDRLRGERDRQYEQNAAQIVRIAELEQEIDRLRQNRVAWPLSPAYR